MYLCCCLDELYYIGIEKKIISTGFSNINDAFEMWFSTYFIFNLKYPRNFSLCLEFIQRHLFKINQEVGSKSSSGSLQTSSILNKVLRLLNKLRDS